MQKVGGRKERGQGETSLLGTPASGAMGKSLGFGIRQTWVQNLLLIRPWTRLSSTRGLSVVSSEVGVMTPCLQRSVLRLALGIMCVYQEGWFWHCAGLLRDAC